MYTYSLFHILFYYDLSQVYYFGIQLGYTTVFYAIEKDLVALSSIDKSLHPLTPASHPISLPW